MNCLKGHIKSAVSWYTTLGNTMYVYIRAFRESGTDLFADLILERPITINFTQIDLALFFSSRSSSSGYPMPMLYKRLSASILQIIGDYLIACYGPLQLHVAIMIRTPKGRMMFSRTLVILRAGLVQRSGSSHRRTKCLKKPLDDPRWNGVFASYVPVCADRLCANG